MTEMIVSWLLAVGLKPLSMVPGFFGGAISAWLLPGPLAAIARWFVRVPVGAVCGAIIAGYGAQPLLGELGKPPESLGIVALAVGAGGLAFLFKVLEAVNRLDLSALLAKAFGNNQQGESR